MSSPTTSKPKHQAQAGATSTDDFLGGRISVAQPRKGHRAGSDAVFLAVSVALLFLPQFTSNKWVFLGVVAVAAAWWVTGVRSRLSHGDAGSDYAKTHLT